MSTRINPVTSHEAYKSVSPEMLSKHHEKIIKALRELHEGTYEELAIKTGMDKTQIGRRLCELERTSIVYKPGWKRKTSTGRNGFVYKLVPIEPVQKSLFDEPIN